MASHAIAIFPRMPGFMAPLTLPAIVPGIAPNRIPMRLVATRTPRPASHKAPALHQPQRLKPNLQRILRPLQSMALRAQFHLPARC